MLCPQKRGVFFFFFFLDSVRLLQLLTDLLRLLLVSLDDTEILVRILFDFNTEEA